MLTNAQVETFNTQGFLVVDDLIDNACRTAVIAEYAALVRDMHRAHLPQAAEPDLTIWQMLDALREAGVEWYQPLDISLPHADIAEDTPMHFGPAVFDMITHQRVLDTVECLIGGEITSNPIQHVRIKPPQRMVDGGETRAHIVSTDWHQDVGVTLPEADETQMVTVWLAVTDATVENGCLQVKPGHRDEILPHCTLSQTGITPKHLPQVQALPVPVKAGGAVIFHPKTPHASLENTSDSYRWSFDLRYHVSGQASGRDQFPSFTARSRSAPDTALRDWRAAKKLWEDARTHLANSAHIPQHRWPSDGPFCA